MPSLRATIAVYVILLLSIVFATAVKSEELRIVNLPEEDVILLTGDIIEGTAQRLDDLLTANPTITKVGMVSGGGLAYEGFNVANVLSNHDVTAIVPRGYVCLSACAIGFIGAKDYVILGALGFHNMYVNDEDMVDIDKLMLIIRGQQFGVRTAMFFIENGFEIELPYIISAFTTPEEFIVFTSTEDLMTFFARSEEDNIIDYLDNNEIDDAWIEEHLWDSARFMLFMQGGDNNAP
jgi:hypothetical protein